MGTPTRRAVLVLFMMATTAASARALEPREVFLLVNKNVGPGREVAEHYCKLRNVPAENVIVLDLPNTEEITRKDYDTLLATPLREALKTKRRQAKVLLSIYGMPLRVGPQPQSEQDKKFHAEVVGKLAEARPEVEAKRRAAKALEEEQQRLQLKPLAEQLTKLQGELAEAIKGVQQLEEAERRWRQAESEAAVDSELMLLWWPEYPKYRWVVNPLYWQVPAENRFGAPQTLMTARLDGPTPEIAKRLVTDAVWAEEKGLKGKVYVDARGIGYDPKADPGGTMYGGYDQSMREMAAQLNDKARLEVILDNKEPLFQPRECRDCMLYCGWYAVKRYTPCCEFNRGAIAWHLASLEAVSLRHPQGQWCGNLLRDGACVTIGAVAEPYTIAFPKPAEFFGFLITGEYTLVESYSRSLFLTSWMMTLVGDPLYNPFKGTKLMSPTEVEPSPKGSKLFNRR